MSVPMIERLSEPHIQMQPQADHGARAATAPIKKVQPRSPVRWLTQESGSFMEEFFEVWTWHQLGIHTKTVVLYNIDCFWGALIAASMPAWMQDSSDRLTGPH